MIINSDLFKSVKIFKMSSLKLQKMKIPNLRILTS